MNNNGSWIQRILPTIAVGAGFAWWAISATAQTEIPEEPIEIGFEPQVFIDDYLVDNRWALRKEEDELVRVFFIPEKYAGNPVISGDGGYPSVMCDEEAGKYRMWYQVFRVKSYEPKPAYTYAIAYAESEDGIHWERPKLNLFDWGGDRVNNIVLAGEDRVQGGAVLEVPESDKRGYRFIMLYRTPGDGLLLAGSEDGIHWDTGNAARIGHDFHADTWNWIVWNPKAAEYLLYTRSKSLYQDRNMLDKGAPRRVSFVSNDSLWDGWNLAPNTSQEMQYAPGELEPAMRNLRLPQTIMIPDAEDAREKFNYFYGLPVKYYGGAFWGFLHLFKYNTDIYTELTISRNGRIFDRLPGRAHTIGLGPEGSWDDGMTFGSPTWMEKNGQWLLYYSGHDGPHGTTKRTPGIGLATIRKEGFAALRGPKIEGGVVVTRRLIWPGGELHVNADADEGELKVRVTDRFRRVFPGFEFGDFETISADGVRTRVFWKERRMEELKGREIRLEFFLRNADLFAFQATESNGTAKIGNR